MGRIVYNLGMNQRGIPLYVDTLTKQSIIRLLREIWNHHPDYDPPKWEDFFEYVKNQKIQIFQDINVVETTLEDVISTIFGPRKHLSKIDPLAEDIVEEYFNDLEPDPTYHQYRLDILNKDSTNTIEVHQILDGVNIHLDHTKIVSLEKYEKVKRELESMEKLCDSNEKRANDTTGELYKIRERLRYTETQEKIAQWKIQNWEKAFFYQAVSFSILGAFVSGICVYNHMIKN